MGERSRRPQNRRHGACYLSDNPLALSAKAPIPAFPRYRAVGGRSPLAHHPPHSQSKIQRLGSQSVASLRMRDDGLPEMGQAGSAARTRSTMSCMMASRAKSLGV